MFKTLLNNAALFERRPIEYAGVKGFVREPSSAERATLYRLHNPDDPLTSTLAMKAHAAALLVLDENGEQAFTAEDIDAVSALPEKFLALVWSQVMDLTKASMDAVDEEKKD